MAGATSAELKISSAVAANSNFYYVVAANSSGAVTSSVVSLSVDLSGSELTLRPRGRLYRSQGNYAAGIQVPGNVAYAVHGYWPELRIIDIANPDSPRQIALVRVGTPFDVALVDDYALVANRAAGIEIIDVRDSTRPVRVRTFKMFGTLASR
ncbi:MAG: hypothetical protein EXS36_01970 [Pedosphaera sp.]|nr:hypothetical protein [Pedosphaera sp.]